MIQLANDPKASRMSYRPAPSDGKPSATAAQKGRSGHAWPFLSQHAGRPVQQGSQKPTANDSGS